jgi:hypothetical protein
VHMLYCRNLDSTASYAVPRKMTEKYDNFCRACARAHTFEHAHCRKAVSREFGSAQATTSHIQLRRWPSSRKEQRAGPARLAGAETPSHACAGGGTMRRADSGSKIRGGTASQARPAAPPLTLHDSFRNGQNGTGMTLQATRRESHGSALVSVASTWQRLEFSERRPECRPPTIPA